MAKLGFTERRFGVPLIDGGTQRLPRIVGMGRALEMILTGRVLEAEEASRWGLLNEVVAEGRHLERALEMAEGLGGGSANDDALRSDSVRRNRTARPRRGRRRSATDDRAQRPR